MLYLQSIIKMSEGNNFMWCELHGNMTYLEELHLTNLKGHCLVEFNKSVIFPTELSYGLLSYLMILFLRITLSELKQDDLWLVFFRF